MVYFKRIIALILSFVIIVVMVPVAFAATDYKQQTDFWQWIAGKGSILHEFLGYTAGVVCPISDDGYHHSDSYLECVNTADGPSYRCVCKYCGEGYFAYASDLQQSYDNYVDTLPVGGINSAGQLIWSPVFKYGYFQTYVNKGPYYLFGDSSDSGISGSSLGNHSISYSQTSSGVNVRFIASGYLSFDVIYFVFEDLYPISGFYTSVGVPLTATIDWYDNKSSFHSYSMAFSPPSSSGLVSQGVSYSYKLNFQFYSGGLAPVSLADIYCPLPIFAITPLDGLLDTTNDTIYNINTRTGIITGGLGIIGDNGTIIQVNNNYIFDETNNVFYSPATNNYFDVNEWYYDYSNRSYSLTLESGVTVTVTYGDDYITIQEGDTITNVYYIIDGEGGDDPGTGGSGSGSDAESAGWLEKIYNKLCDILEAISGIDIPGVVNVNYNGSDGSDDEEDHQEDFFTEFTSKYNWVTSMFDIFKQLKDDVLSDAASAEAVAEGIAEIDMLSSGHAVPIDGAGGGVVYTAPELAINLGASDKYGVDWSGIKVVDLSWYASYKSTVDSIVSGILWLSYIFLLIKRAPAIIRGVEMVTEDHTLLR